MFSQSCIILVFTKSLLVSAILAGHNVFPVYPEHTSRSAQHNASDTMDIVVGTVYKVNPPEAQRRSNDGGLKEDGRGVNEDLYLIGMKEACRRDSITSCWKYNTLTFFQSLLQALPPTTTTGRSASDEAPHLVGLPIGNSSYSLLGRSSYWGFGDFYLFLERQVSRFIQGHGILFPATSWDEAVTQEFRNPVLIDSDSEVQEGRATHQRKVKRKSVLFPLLVLFKFFKIKMILIPILLTVLFVKKLLIITLALAPNLAGLFRVCRPGVPGLPPFGLASAGILQDVTDNRGEFSSIYNTYANPYRDYHGYRTRDFGRYAEPPRHSTQSSDTGSDYS